MKTLFYVKGSRKDGLGHVRRSLAIAKYCRRRKNAQVSFVLEGDNSAASLLGEDGFEHFIAARKSEAQKRIMNIIDNKNINLFFCDIKDDVSLILEFVKSKGVKTCVLDNVTAARYLADIIVYPAAHFNDNLDWKGFSGVKLNGGEFFPLDEAFIQAKRQKKEKRGRLSNILVTMGGADPNKLTLKVLDALRQFNENFTADVVIGPSFCFDVLPPDSRFRIINAGENMAAIIQKADVAVTAFGVTLYELAFMGVPAIIISNYKDDGRDAKSFGKLGTSLSLGYYKKVSRQAICDAIEKIISNKILAKKMSRRGMKLIDGQGVRRIVESL